MLEEKKKFGCLSLPLTTKSLMLELYHLLWQHQDSVARSKHLQWESCRSTE